MAVGIVKWFSSQKSYGFVSQENGPDLFVHHSAFHGEGDRSLGRRRRWSSTSPKVQRAHRLRTSGPWARFRLASGLWLWRRRLPA